MVYRIFVEKKREFANEARSLKSDINTVLRIEGLDDLRVVNRYDVENIDAALFEAAKAKVFSEPQIDDIYDSADFEGACAVFAVESLPGQFDMRADSAAQCIQIISMGEKPLVRTAKVYALYGDISEKELEEIQKYVINPVESRFASFELPETLKMETEIPEDVKTIEGFIDLEDTDLAKMASDMGLAMDADDLRFCRDYFRKEKRNPTITEIRMIDTYWSDHCRHTTFLTTVDNVKFEDEKLEAAYNRYVETRKKLGKTKPVNLMDIATLGARYLKSEGKLDALDESDEINACTVKIKANIDGEDVDYLLLFKNETHNHPTEIEPFGGAATCIGGAIRDPLSGRSYVYAAMRVTGAADPTRPVAETIPGKLPQRKIVTTAAAGYSSYGNQIGLATGMVDELYHDGYAAKRMEIGAVLGAAPAKNVRREVPGDGDIVILLGGRTGRDGCGGATGSSKSHTKASLETCGAEVQKGNAPEERKLQRLFRNPEAARLIKRCNDFGAGGVSVAVGELADGLEIDLNAVPKKYDGLDGTELAISESQERMAIVVEAKDAERFIEIAKSENLEATPVARVTAEPRLVMKHNGKKIVDISREFLNSNGAEKHIDITLDTPSAFEKEIPESFEKGMRALAEDLNVCSKRGLSERFDSTIGAGSVLMPFGGSLQHTPIQAMVHKIPLERGETDTVSFMSWGYNPYITEKSPYHGAYLAVVESISKLIATGADKNEVFLTFQEYFEKPMRDPKRWGKPMAALLGAFAAQLDYSSASIGGKDSMSGTFENIDIPPTLVSFAVTTGKLADVISPEFKKADSRVILLVPEYDKDGLPVCESELALYDKVNALMRAGRVSAAYTPTYGGVAEAVMKMSFGNGLGFEFNEETKLETLFGYNYGAFVLEMCDDTPVDGEIYLGKTTKKCPFVLGEEKVCSHELLEIYENKLESVFSCNIKVEEKKLILPETHRDAKALTHAKVGVAKPRVLIPVFPGTNCEYDSARAAERAGLEADIFVIRNITGADIAESVEEALKRIEKSQIIFIPGGFSGGDEPDGSGKFITAFFRNPKLADSVNNLLKNRDGLMCGICNGFQALIKLGLVPYGEICDIGENDPTLTYNVIGRHQSRIVRTRVLSNKSPWLMNTKPGEIYNVPISHGEGRFIAPAELIEKLAANGQIATQYADINGNPTFDISYNPNSSDYAIEGITSPDGRVIGKMGHSERISMGTYKNVDGDYDIKLFKSASDYYKI
ncbi:MAG: phosphoribosylformylglycinamidine synthase [Ruminococcaceae bacterium]|nr:phosphoribosylformylglycinamidine synthase [Oscillospiraceae bacterium]